MAALVLPALLVVWACGGNNSGAAVGDDFYFEYVTVFGPDETPGRLTIEGRKAELCRQWATTDTGMQTIGFFRTMLDESDLAELLAAFPSEAKAHEMRPDEPYFLFRLNAAGRHDSLRVPRQPEALARVGSLVTVIERLEAKLLARAQRTLALEIQPLEDLKAGVPVRLYNAGVEPATVVLTDSTLWVERTDLPTPVGDSGVTPLPIVWERIAGYTTFDTVTVPADSVTDILIYLNVDLKGDFLLRARFERQLMPGDNRTEISGSIASRPFPFSVQEKSEFR